MLLADIRTHFKHQRQMFPQGSSALQTCYDFPALKGIEALQLGEEGCWPVALPETQVLPIEEGVENVSEPLA